MPEETIHEDPASHPNSMAAVADGTPHASSSPASQSRFDEQAQILQVFVEQAERTKTLLPGGRFDRTAVKAAADIVRVSNLYTKILGTRLRKVGVSQSEIDGFLAAVNRRASGRGIRLIPASEILTRPDPEFLIEGLVEERGLSVVYGDPDSYKTFLVLAWSFCIGLGIPWLGKKVMAGPVIYVVAEGSRGIQKRLRALMEHHGLDRLPPDLYFIDRSVNLLDDYEVAETIEEAEDLGVKPVLVVFDTYARNLVGADENSSKDVGQSIAAIDKLRIELETTVIVIHHLTKDGRTERGSGVLRGATEAMLLVEKKADGTAVLRVNRQKNYEAGPPIRLQARKIEAVDSLVLEEAGTSTTGQSMWMTVIGGDDPDTKKREKLRSEIEKVLEELQAAGATPIVQNKLLASVKGYAAELKTDVLHELADNPDSPVEMEDRGKSKVYCFVPRP
jgi:hypothetical protein